MSKKGDNNLEIIRGLEDMYNRYKQEKSILDKAMADNKTECSVKAEEVFNSIEKLYLLKINGPKIKESQEKQLKARNSENFSPINEVYCTPTKTPGRIRSAISDGLNYIKSNIFTRNK